MKITFECPLSKQHGSIVIYVPPRQRDHYKLKKGDFVEVTIKK